MATCREHLDATSTRGTEIESILVGYLLTVAYSEYEQAVRAIVVERGRSGDVHLTAFMEFAALRLIRSIRVGELCGVLAAFDNSCKEAFSAEIVDTRAHAAYDSIINNRQAL